MDVGSIPTRGNAYININFIPPVQKARTRIQQLESTERSVLALDSSYPNIRKKHKYAKMQNI